MTTRIALARMPLIAAVLILGASDLSAQVDGQGSGMGRGMMEGGMLGGMMGNGMMSAEVMDMMGHGVGMMATGGPGPETILRMGDALNLTAEQRSRLQAIQTEYTDSVLPLMAGVREAHESAAAALEGESPDFEAYERALREGAEQMVQAHVAIARAATEARDVLTDEQRERLRGGAQMMQGMMGQGMRGP